MRGKSTVAHPGLQAARRVLDVLADEGYIRGYEAMTGERRPPGLEISLKYYEGTPVIRELKRVSKPGRRVYPASRHPAGPSGSGRDHRLDAQGRHVRCRGARQANVGGEVLCTVF
jgi:small subunit ribosomal protein S8